MKIDYKNVEDCVIYLLNTFTSTTPKGSEILACVYGITITLKQNERSSIASITMGNYGRKLILFNPPTLEYKIELGLWVSNAMDRILGAIRILEDEIKDSIDNTHSCGYVPMTMVDPTRPPIKPVWPSGTVILESEEHKFNKKECEFCRMDNKLNFLISVVLISAFFSILSLVI